MLDVVIGGVLGWGGGAWTQWRTSRNTRRDARSDRCREAYAALILALDGLERAWTAGETIELDDRLKTIGQISGRSIREIHQAYVAVLLTGSKEAKNRAEAARNAAWDLNDRLHGRAGGLDHETLGNFVNKFTDAARLFVERVEHELG